MDAGMEILTRHYSDVTMGMIASQITSLTIVYSIANSGADQRKHQSFASLAFVRGIHRRQVNSPHKWPVTRKKFPSDDVIMIEVHDVFSQTANTRRWTSIRHRSGTFVADLVKLTLIRWPLLTRVPCDSSNNTQLISPMFIIGSNRLKGITMGVER